MRLLWGSRLNASTRMTALLALGILVSTAFGVIVVQMVNQGFSGILNAEAVRMRAAPDNTINFSTQLRAGDPNLPLAQARIDTIERDFTKALGHRLVPEWKLRAAHFVLVPEGDTARLLRATKARDEALPPAPGKAASRVDYDTWRAQSTSVEDQFAHAIANIAIREGNLCAAEGVGPQRLDEIWVQRSWGNFGQPIGSSYVAILASLLIANQDSSRGFPLHRKLRVVRLAPLSMRAQECAGWVSPRLLDVVQRREPQRVDHILSWNGSALPSVEKKWFDDMGAHRFGTRKQSWVAGQKLSADDRMRQETNLKAAEKVLGVQRLVSWLVVGMMVVLAIYQVCSLMMMLGLHFRFDVAMLRSLGMSRWRVMAVFIVSSLVIMSVGLGVGMLAAWCWLPYMNVHLAWVMERMDAKDLVDWVPWVRDAGFAWRAWGAGLVLGALAGLIPAFMASRARPSDIWKAET